MKKLALLACLIVTSCFAFADSITIKGFDIKDNPYGQDQISIVAVDSLHNTMQNVNGAFVFTLNGLKDTLKFNDGVAFYKHKIDRSPFIYARHVNESGTHSSLYYVYKSESK